MAPRLYPDARLLPSGEVVSFDDATLPLPNFTGLVYVDSGGRPYVMWRTATTGCELPDWQIVNAGQVIVQSELDAFLKSQEKP